MAVNIIKRTWHQNQMVKIEPLNGFAFQAESGGHTFQISGIDDSGNAVPISGTIAGVFLRPDNTDVALTGSASGGVASVTLKAECYAVPGRFLLTVYATSGSNKGTIYAAMGTVSRTSSGAVSPAASSDVVDLVNRINAATATIPASYTTLLNAVATDYSPDATYPKVGTFVWYSGKLYRSKVPITTAETWTAAHWNQVVLSDALNQDITDLKSASNAEYALDRKENGIRNITPSAFVHGGISNASNFPLTLTNVTTRARPCGFIKVNKGDRFIVKPGSYKFAVYMWTGNPENGANVVNRNWSTTDYEKTIVSESFALVAYADKTDTTATINLANFDGSIQIVPYEQDQFAEVGNDINTVEEETEANFESINSYDDAKLFGWVQGAAYKETGGDKIVTNTSATRCNLMMTRIDENIQRIYAKSGYQFNVFACTIDGNNIYHVVTGSYATWQTSVDVSDYSDEYYLVIYVSKTNTSSNIIPSEAQENILYVSKFGKKIVNDIESRQHNPYGLKNPLICPASPRITMHRGLMGQAPENTVPAFLLAGQGGAWGIETDVWETTDGYFILNHNNDVSGMTDGTGNITSMTYAQVQACTVDSGVNINLYPNLKLATIEEYLQICRRYGCVACIEIKGITHYDNFLNKILEYGMEGSTIIFIGWDESKVGTLRGITNIPIMILGDSNFSTLLSNTEKFTDLWLGVDKTLISESNLNQAHLKNVPVAAWAYLNQSDIEDAVAMGLDIAVANNNPTID